MARCSDCDEESLAVIRKYAAVKAVKSQNTTPIQLLKAKFHPVNDPPVKAGDRDYYEADEPTEKRHKKRQKKRAA